MVVSHPTIGIVLERHLERAYCFARVALSNLNLPPLNHGIYVPRF